jgi:hypothetical protein
MQNLPIDVFRQIISELDAKTLVVARLVSKKWKEEADVEKLWERHFRSTFGTDILRRPTAWSNRTSKFQRKFAMFEQKRVVKSH